MTSQPITFFNSQAKFPHYYFSNFYSPIDTKLCILWPDASCIPGFLQGKLRHYSTAEHAYQCLKSKDLASADAFCVGGTFDSWAVYETWPKSGKTQVNIRKLKEGFWGKKRMLGIIPKMVSNVNPVLLVSQWGVKFSKNSCKWATEELECIWTTILTAKFGASGNPTLQSALAETGTKRLVELNTRAIANTVYGAKMVNGKMIGHNFMGEMLMKIRANLLCDETPGPTDFLTLDDFFAGI
jgi:hypothetical protein